MIPYYVSIVTLIKPPYLSMRLWILHMRLLDDSYDYYHIVY